jgi:nitrite reductase/ring-hydroxylating ferredoxin subunit
MTRICKISDIKMDKAKNFNVQNVELSIIHTKDGFFARSGVCKHNGIKLELCSVSGKQITCPYHGWTYHVESGKGIQPSHTFLSCYQLKIRGDEIWVDISKKNDDDFEIDTSRYQW